jgi:hypothetical protein
LLEGALHMRKYAVAGLALAAAAFLCPGAVARATTADDICDAAAPSCVLQSQLTVTAGSTLDFGTRAFVIKAPNGRLRVDTGDTLSISAGSMVVETGVGGRLQTVPGSDGGCTIHIRVTGTFAVTRVGTAALGIDLSSPGEPCALDISADGDVTIGGEIHAQGIGLGGSGGEVLISTAGRVTLSDRILVDSPFVGGVAELDAAGPIEVTASGGMDASDAVGVGSVVLATDADLVTAGNLDVKGRPSDYFGCDAGFVILSALGDITINGPISGSGASLPEAGCLGGTLNMLARGSIFVNAPIDFSGGPNGGGGFLEDVEAGGDFIQSAPITVGAAGQAGIAGDVDIIAAHRLHIGALLDLSGGLENDPESGLVGGAGFLNLTAADAIEIAGEVNADGADFGSLVFATARESESLPGRIVVSGDIHAVSGADEDLPADIRLEACEIEVTESGSIRKIGPASRNLLRASSAMKIAGSLDAGSGVNELEYRDPTRPPLLLPTATVSPAPNVTATPDEPLLPCACTLDPLAAGLLCNDGNPCTQEACDADLGCTSTPLAGEGIAGCDDGNICDGRETCEAVACHPGPPPPADDGDPCTDDGPCDPVAGYARTPKTGFGAATCRMDRIAMALAKASVPGDASAKSLKKVRKLAQGIRSTLENAAGAGGKRRKSLLRAAAKRLGQLDRVLKSKKTSLSSALSQLIATETGGVRTLLTQL